jgi:hypothetical protein
MMGWVRVVLAFPVGCLGVVLGGVGMKLIELAAWIETGPAADEVEDGEGEER